MRMLKILGFAGAIAAGLAIVPSLSQAANTASQADRLLEALRNNAHVAATDAARLDSLRLELGISWQLHAGYLGYLREDVNAMGATVGRLGGLRSQANPQQQKEIDDAASLVQTLATNANSAIVFLNGNHLTFAVDPSYTRNLGNLSAETTRLSHSLDQYFEFAKLRRKEIRLQKDLGSSSD